MNSYHNLDFRTVNNISQDFKNLYISMAVFYENNRRNAAKILQYYWFNEINNLNNEQLLDLEKNVRNEFFSREAQVKENIQLNNDHLFDNMNFGENNNILNCFIIIFFN